MSSASEAVPVPASEAAVLSLLGIMPGLPYLAADAFLADLHVPVALRERVEHLQQPKQMRVELHHEATLCYGVGAMISCGYGTGARRDRQVYLTISCLVISQHLQ